MQPTKFFRHNRGFTMIEILVTLVITAVGMLGLAGFVVRATTLSADSVQRGKAAVLVNDMAGRLNNSKAIAADFVAANGATLRLYGAAPEDCTGQTDANLQLCEWNNLLFGTNVVGGSGSALLGYRGCITRPNALDPLYIITVTWGSMSQGTPPTDQCGKDVFGPEADGRRRALRLQVRVANLIGT